jgi:hypothetical protein
MRFKKINALDIQVGDWIQDGPVEGEVEKIHAKLIGMNLVLWFAVAGEQIIKRDYEAVKKGNAK